MKTKNEAAVALGKMSHKRQSPAQSAASAKNGKKGGRPRTKSLENFARSVAEVNRVIKHLGVELVRGDGYFYFVSLDRRYGQVGNQIMLCYVNQRPLYHWRMYAKMAVMDDPIMSA